MESTIQKLSRFLEKLKEEGTTYEECFLNNRDNKNSEVMQLENELFEKAVLSKKCEYGTIIIRSLMCSLQKDIISIDTFKDHLMNPAKDFIQSSDRYIGCCLSGIRAI